MHNSSALKLINDALTKVIRSDPESQTLLCALDGKIFQVAIHLPIRINIWLKIDAGAILLSLTAFDDSADATFTGSAFAFLRLLSTDSTTKEVGITLDGDTNAAEHLFSGLKKLHIDWEEFIAKRIGDELTYSILSPLKAIVNWKKNSMAEFAETMAEYVKYEANHLPSTPEVSLFVHDVDQLNADLGRLEAKIARLSLS